MNSKIIYRHWCKRCSVETSVPFAVSLPLPCKNCGGLTAYNGAGLTAYNGATETIVDPDLFTKAQLRWGQDSE